MIYRCCPTYVAAASQTLGIAVALCDGSKHCADADHVRPGHTFVPSSVETYLHLGKPIMLCFRTLNDMVTAHSLAIAGGRFSLVPTGHCAWLLYRVRVTCTALACSCSPRQRGCMCCVGRTCRSLIESSVVVAVPPPVGRVTFFCVCLGVSGCFRVCGLMSLHCRF
jgi:hypothetical protein